MTGDGPYVGLDCFREEDAGLFFGRDAERTRIIGNLRASRLTLLHAESGVGKSSLLRAGVTARLRDLASRSAAREEAPRYLPVVFSGWSEHPTQAVIDALVDAARPLLADGAALAPRRDGLHAAIGDVAEATGATVLVILDQFEEHFLYEPREDGGFDDELARCVVDRALHAHFLISVREDAYALIGQRYKALIPNVYANWLDLDFLDPRAAHAAIVEPLSAFSDRNPSARGRFEIEPELVEAVLDEVRLGRVAIGEDAPADAMRDPVARVETAYLQLVMKRLWDEEVAAGSRRLRRETLRRLGGAGTIVRAHLDDAMDGLTDDGRDAAAEALRFLVTTGGRKIPLSTQELSEFSGLAAPPLEPVLAHLERRRILRAVPAPDLGGSPRRELFHDVLAPAVVDWRRRHAQADADRRVAASRARSRRLEARNRRLAAAVIALTAAIAALGLYTWNPGWVRRLELRTVDARFALQGTRPADPNVSLVAVDDRTLRSRGAIGGRLPRGEWASLLHRLQAQGAAVIALDVAFSTSRDPAGDSALRSALESTRNRLVLAYTHWVTYQEPDGRLTVRPLLFGRPVVQSYREGVAKLPVDGDGRVRRVNYVLSYRSRRSADVLGRTFAFVAADLARHGELQPRLDRLPVASRRAWGEQNDRATWIDFRGPAGTVPRISALDVLDGRAPPGRLRGKVVVVGVTGGGTTDRHSTPFRDRRMPGAEVEAAAIATIMNDSPLRDADPSADVAAFVLAAALGALAALLLPRMVGLLAVAGVAVAALGVAYALFLHGTILAVVAPLCALLLSAAGVAAFGARRAMRRSHAGG